MSLGGLEWQRPWVLLLLLLLPLLFVRRRRPALLLPTFSALRALGPGIRGRLAWLPRALRTLALALVVLALARPVTPAEGGIDLSVEGIDIVVALDLSGSMQAVDFQPKDRLHVAKEVLDAFVQRRPHDRLGLVVFAGEAYTQCPLTLDHRVFRSILRRLEVGNIPDGTAIGDAIATALNRLRKSEAESRIVILITDGDSNAGAISPLEAAGMAAELGIRVFPILVGRECDDPRGCLVPFPAGTDFFGSRIFRNVRIPTDPKLLETIARKTGGSFYRATDRESLEGHLQDVLETLEKSRLVEERQLTGFEDRFEWFLFPGIFALLVELWLTATWLRRFP